MKDQKVGVISSGLPEGARDCKVGLVVFGVLEILLGACCALLLLMTLAGMLMAGRMEGLSPAGDMIPAVLLYGALAAWFIWMGVGSILARRWARALLLVSSWLWLVSGVAGMLVLLLFLPTLNRQMISAGQFPETLVGVLIYGLLGFTAFFYILVPGILVLFYGNRHVRATCAARDPRTRWTDRCPLPVLAVSFSAALMAGGLLLAGFYSWAMPFFGVLATGLAGMLLSLGCAVLLGGIAWGAYRLRISAWWGAVALTAAWAISTMLSFSRIPWDDFFRAIDLPPEQMPYVEPFLAGWLPWMLPLTGLWTALVLGYLLYTRKFFPPGAPPTGRMERQP